MTMIIQPSIDRTAVASEWVCMLLEPLDAVAEGGSISIVSAMFAVGR